MSSLFLQDDPLDAPTLVLNSPCSIPSIQYAASSTGFKYTSRSGITNTTVDILLFGLGVVFRAVFRRLVGGVCWGWTYAQSQNSCIGAGWISDQARIDFEFEPLLGPLLKFDHVRAAVHLLSTARVSRLYTGTVGDEVEGVVSSAEQGS